MLPYRMLLTLLFIALLTPGAAGAISLADLAAGGGTSAGGVETSGWSILDLSDVPVDLAAIDVTAVADASGSSLVFDTSLVTNGDIIDLLFEFTFSATPAGIDGLDLSLQGASVTAGSVLELSASIGGAALVVSPPNPSASATIAPTTSAKGFFVLLVDDTGALDAATLRFNVVPEPGTASLLALGLALCGVAGRTGRKTR